MKRTHEWMDILHFVNFRERTLLKDLANISLETFVSINFRHESLKMLSLKILKD